MSARPDAARRARRWTLTIAALAGFLVWNAVFDLWLGQGERQYLWERAKYEMGRGPGVTLDGSMASSMHDGAWVATAWAGLVVASVLLASYVSFRLARHESQRQPTVNGADDSRAR